MNVTRAPMVHCGYCPSGRLFEAAACGTPVLSDRWAGMDEFFEPGQEVLLSNSVEETLDVLSRNPAELARIGRAARRRTLAEHTGFVRAGELVALLSGRLPSLSPEAGSRAAAAAVNDGASREVFSCGE
ncbi:MAG: glycosyltransferase [Polyangiaceae bacterium]